MITIKRAYENPESEDGHRFLVDRLWPRGVTKEALRIEDWLTEVAPSTELRRWFAHDPERWDDFRQRYWAELEKKPESWQQLLKEAHESEITLVYAARDEKHNNAVALRAFLMQKLGGER